MKQVFKCDYCTFIGTEEMVQEHEPICLDNYNRKSCTTCKHKSLKSLTQFACACGKEIPNGKMFEDCEKYERKEKDTSQTDLFKYFFGGALK